MTQTQAAPFTPIATLRGIYFARFALALVWALTVIVAIHAQGAPLTVLLVIYPVIDAVAVIAQLRSERANSAPRVAEMLNVILSLLAAVALGWAATISVPAALVAWGVWAAVAGILQLVTAILRRRVGGQVPLIVSGAISIFAGLGFLGQGIGGATSAVALGGYALLGGVFFLVAAIRLTVVARRSGVRG